MVISIGLDACKLHVRRTPGTLRKSGLKFSYGEKDLACNLAWSQVLCNSNGLAAQMLEVDWTNGEVKFYINTWMWHHRRQILPRGFWRIFRRTPLSVLCQKLLLQTDLWWLLHGDSENILDGLLTCIFLVGHICKNRVNGSCSSEVVSCQGCKKNCFRKFMASVKLCTKVIKMFSYRSGILPLIRLWHVVLIQKH